MEHINVSPKSEPVGRFYDYEYFIRLEYRVFSGAHGSRVRNILEALGDITGKKVLDVGAGGGAFSKLMSERGASVYAIDYSPDTVRFISERFPEVQAKELSIYDLNKFKEFKPDIITLFDVIEHLADQESAVRNCLALLKSGGRLIISTDAYRGPYSSKGLIRRVFYAFEHISKQGIIYRGLKRAEKRHRLKKNYHLSHIGELTSEALVDLVEHCGGKIVEHRIYPLVGSSLRDFVLQLFPKKYRGDHQCMIVEKV